MANYGGPAPNTAGPHSSNIANKLDPRIDSDLDGSRIVGGTGAYPSASHGSGAHASGLHGDGFAHTGSSHTAGPHNSNILNQADPRIDSDLDGSRTVGGTGAYAPGSHGPGAHATGAHNSTFAHTGPSHTAGSSYTAGPHNSDTLNKVDPRVDSDLDGSRTIGGGNAHQTPGYSHTGASHTAGPHNSDALNKADPRVDSDRDNRAAHHGTHAEGAHGPHSSRAANAADPRVDSDRDHRAAAGHHSGLGSAAGAAGLARDPASVGPASSTAGPHKSNLLNKLDPRVDSNLDGSKTIGGDKTFATQ